MSCSKRTYSFSSSSRLNFNCNSGNSGSGGGGGGNAPPKKKKKYNRTTTFVPPTKFLLGGNIRDPLNLNGLQQEDEETNAEEDKPGKDVALPALADFLLGGNINDPLNLKGIAEQETAAAAAAAAATAAAFATEVKQDADAESSTADVAGTANDGQRLAATVAGDEVAATAAKKTAISGAGAISAVGVCQSGAVMAAAESGLANKSAAPNCVEGVVVLSGPEGGGGGSGGVGSSSGYRVNGTKAFNLNLNVNAAAQVAAVAAAIDPRTRKLDRKDKIVSPVIPQPYRPLKTLPFRQIITPDLGTKASKTPKFREKNTRFQYGNYQRYYSYRNAHNSTDLRVEILEKHRDFFENKDVLDVGCNVGHMSFVVARSFGAKSVTGVDIDRYLVDVANKSVQYYVNCPSPYSIESPNPTVATAAAAAAATSTSVSASATSNTLGVESPVAAAAAAAKKVDLKYKCYPVSMPILYGPIYDPDFQNAESRSTRTFPKNVRFVHGNYVLESETLLQAEQPQYDTVMCLSVTKWIHLNWGDEGLKMAFKRMYAQLRPGGLLILEPQSWDSYKRKKSLTETIWRNYRNIQLFPHHFDRYLLSSEVGFSRCQTLAVVNHQQKGFRRAIKVFKKPMSSVHSLVSPNPVVVVVDDCQN